MITIKLVKDEDKKHSVKFKPLSEADKKFCSAFYLARPVSNNLTDITVIVKEGHNAPI